MGSFTGPEGGSGASELNVTRVEPLERERQRLIGGRGELPGRRVDGVEAVVGATPRREVEPQRAHLDLDLELRDVRVRQAHLALLGLRRRQVGEQLGRRVWSACEHVCRIGQPGPVDLQSSRRIDGIGHVGGRVGEAHPQRAGEAAARQARNRCRRRRGRTVGQAGSAAAVVHQPDAELVGLAVPQREPRVERLDARGVGLVGSADELVAEDVDADERRAGPAREVHRQPERPRLLHLELNRVRLDRELAVEVARVDRAHRDLTLSAAQ